MSHDAEFNSEKVEVTSPNYCFAVDLATARAGLKARYSRDLQEVAALLRYACSDEESERQRSNLDSLIEAFTDRFEQFATDDDQDAFRNVLGVVNTLHSLRNHLEQKCLKRPNNLK